MRPRGRYSTMRTDLTMMEPSSGSPGQNPMLMFDVLSISPPAISDAPSTPVALAANGRWKEILELTVPETGRLTARLDPAGDYAEDNTVAEVI